MAGPIPTLTTVSNRGGKCSTQNNSISRWTWCWSHAYLRDGATLNDDDLGVPGSGPFRATLSVFVTLKKHDALRGCIGHILPIQPLWKDIRDNAISAAVQMTPGSRR